MRPDDWPERLAEFIEHHLKTPFSWGDHDCSQFVIKCEIAITSQTKFSDSIGRYSSKRGSYLHLKRQGFRSLWPYVSSRYTEIGRSFAKRGDVVGHYTQDGESVGILLDKCFACPSDDGIYFKPIHTAHRFWRFD